MLASINPLGERARGTKFSRTFGWYLAGSAAGGALIGALAGLVGEGFYALADPEPAAIGLVVAVVCIVGILLDLGVGGLRLPTVHRQVNEDWLTRYRGWLYGVGFGFQLGLGVVTIVTTSAVYVMLVLAVLTGSVTWGAIVGTTFGVVRAIPLLIVGRVSDAGHLRSAMRRVIDLAPLADRIAGASIALVAVTGVVAFTVRGVV